MRTMRTMRTQVSSSGLTDATEWQGTASELLRELGAILDESGFREKDRPRAPKDLSDRLRRAAPFLRERGIDIDFKREGHRRARMIYISAEAPLSRAEQEFPAEAQATVTNSGPSPEYSQAPSVPPECTIAYPLETRLPSRLTVKKSTVIENARRRLEGSESSG